MADNDNKSADSVGRTMKWILGTFLVASLVLVLVLHEGNKGIYKNLESKMSDLWGQWGR
ncbi:hypothetical protein [Methylobacterium sp. 1030]|uniref:hypothetical protein n=1 Tax=Methylobacterium sp. 1030 TaxID=3156404 RepID=UPI003392AC20